MVAKEPGPIWSKMRRATTTVEAITPFIVEIRELRRGYSKVTAATRGVTQLRVWRGNLQLLVQRSVEFFRFPHAFEQLREFFGAVATLAVHCAVSYYICYVL